MGLTEDICKKFVPNKITPDEVAAAERLKICDWIASQAEEFFNNGPNDYATAARWYCYCLKIEQNYVPA